MATWYVLKDPDNAGKIMAKAGAWPTAAVRDSYNTNIHTVLNARTDGDVVVIGAGTYSGTELGTGSSALVTLSKAITVRDAQNGDAGFPSNSGKVIFDGLSGDAMLLWINKAGIVVSKIKFKGMNPAATRYQVRGDFNWTGNDLEFDGGRVCLWQTAGVVTLNRPVFSGGAGSVGEGRLRLSSAGNAINFPIFKHVRANPCVYSVADNTINHPVFVDCHHAAIQTGGGVCTVNNPILSGVSSELYYPFTASSGLIVVNNPVMSAGAEAWGRISSGSVTINNAKYAAPGFRTPNRPALLMFGVDDTNNIGYFDSIASKLEAYGWRGTFAYSAPTEATTEQKALIANLVRRGHCISAHADKFANNLTDLKGLSIAYSGAGVATCTITSGVDGATSLVVTIDGSAAVTVPITSSTIINDVVSAIDAHASLACVKTNTAYNLSLYSRYLSAVSDSALSGTAKEFSLDADRVYDDEMSAPKSEIEAQLASAGVTYVCDTWICPGNDTSADYRAQLHARGFVVSRGAAGPTSGAYQEQIGNVYDIRSIGCEALLGSEDPAQEAVNQRVHGLVEYLHAVGGAAFVFAHQATIGGQDSLTLAGWDKVLKAVSQSPHVQVCTLKEAGEFIRTYDPSGDLATSDGMTYTRTFTDEVDVRLLPSSLAVHSGAVITGVNDGAQTDPWGNAMLDYPNIGADQYNYAPGFGPWSTCDASLPTSGQIFKSNAAPIAAKKVTVFPGVASQAQINEAKE